MAPELKERLKAIKLLVLDVDGVLTDASLYYGPEGELQKRYHVRDGLGIRMAQHFGIAVGVISARKSSLVERRMNDLKIAHWYTGQEDKLLALDELLAKCGLSRSQAAYVGDDLFDVPVMRVVGAAFAVGDGHECAKAVAHQVTRAAGGAGAIREVADAILDAQFGLSAAYERFLAATTSAGRTDSAGSVLQSGTRQS
jgi:3-deoxy-D-manno-octulosonate 8-phosphate phosphatase (KDO 8-P phosphatase)